MSRLNLLPWREEARVKAKKNFIVMGLSTLILGVASVIGWSAWMDNNISYQQGRNQYLVKETKQLDKQIKEIKELEVTRKGLNERIAIIDQLQSTRPSIVHLFDEMVKSLPNGLYLTKIKQKGKKVTLEGKAESNARVSSYMDRLNASAWLNSSDLDIISVDKRAGNEMNLRSFRLGVMQLLKPKEQKGGTGGFARTQ